jgi:hypothetical protein
MMLVMVTAQDSESRCDLLGAWVQSIKKEYSRDSGTLIEGYERENDVEDRKLKDNEERHMMVIIGLLHFLFFTSHLHDLSI